MMTRWSKVVLLAAILALCWGVSLPRESGVLL